MKIESTEILITSSSFIVWGSDDDDEWVILEEFETWDKAVREFKSEPPYSYVMITGGTMVKKNGIVLYERRA